MAFEFITTEDLLRVKEEIIDAFKEIVLDQPKPIDRKKCLKSEDVMKLLRISPSTLQTLRIKKIIPYSRIGKTLFYDYEDIMKIIADTKTMSKYKQTKK